ncbi:hypothetical protein [Streptomyces sp. NPDC050428]|uniref:hypothetical protein n=1 Tax=Streptomyces sp. NPDC050428 TaxID=3155757 RepID=UPI003418C079
MTVDKGTGTARQANIGGAVLQVVGRVIALGCWVGAPVLPALAVFGDLHWAWSFFSLLMVLSGSVIWSDVAEAKADTARLRQSGRPAVAKIIAAKRVDPEDGSADISVLTLRISGTDVPSFEATYRCDHEERFRVGASFKAVVDPSDNLFTLVPL